MPTITVDKYELFEALGRTYTRDEFEELCFDFGVELDEDTEDGERPIVNGVQEPPQLKIEISANRYDMLCFEGITLMLNIFLGRSQMPQYRHVQPAGDGDMLTITVAPETAKVRPLVAGAVLRNIKFTKRSYDSFIGLQDKLHQNLARQRTLVAIGTHDLDTIKGPFTYEAHPPADISFVPLNQTKKLNGSELMQFYENDKHLGRYLHIIRDSPVYPVIYDSTRTVCSLPPIINSEHSKITLNTKNVFIDITATDETKLDIVCNIMVAMFSQYCAEPFTVEPVKIISEHNGKTRVTPSLNSPLFEANVDYINSCTGLGASAADICKLLARMGHIAKPSPTDINVVEVRVPPTRPDVLHQCDIMEDVAIAHGFNSLPRMQPNKSATIGEALPINKLADILRLESAMCGWIEVLPLILCSHDENFAWLRRIDDNATAVKLANPKSVEFQVVRTSLLPGLLKTLRENKKHSLPMRIFESADVVYRDDSLERKARNERHFGAAWCGKTSGFEQVHGLLDRLMLMLRVPFIGAGEDLPDQIGAAPPAAIAAEKLTSTSQPAPPPAQGSTTARETPGSQTELTINTVSVKANGYWIEEISEDTFFPGRAAAIWLRKDGKEKRIGEFGIIHPEVLEKFEIKYPVSTLEFNIEVFL